jgi:hypothetical protein
MISGEIVLPTDPEPDQADATATRDLRLARMLAFILLDGRRRLTPIEAGRRAFLLAHVVEHDAGGRTVAELARWLGRSRSWTSMRLDILERRLAIRRPRNRRWKKLQCAKG